MCSSVTFYQTSITHHLISNFIGDLESEDFAVFLRRLRSKKTGSQGEYEHTDDVFVFESSKLKSFGYMIQKQSSTLQATDVVDAMNAFSGAFLTVVCIQNDDFDVSQVLFDISSKP